jgi:hypothetical protein
MVFRQSFSALGRLLWQWLLYLNDPKYAIGEILDALSRAGALLEAFVNCMTHDELE